MSRRATSCVPIALAMAVALAVWGGAAPSASAQSLVEMYRAARFKTQAERVTTGFRAQPLAPAHLSYPTDSLREWVDTVFPPELLISGPERPTLTVSKWELVPKLGRGWFRSKFNEAKWAYVGSNSLSVVDTTFTRDLRARLQAEFGSPTQTIADLDHSRTDRPAEYIQFEYWFVLNDSIPLMVMDVNGPFERGLVVASARSYQDVLADIKDALLGRLGETDARAAYADYYYLSEQRMWFLTGYDGEKYYIERIARPDLKLGRPLLEQKRD